MIKSTLILVLLLVFTGKTCGQAIQNEPDSTDIYYRALRNYLKFEKTPPVNGSWNKIYLKTDGITTRNVPDTVDGTAIVMVDLISELKAKEFTIFYIRAAEWKNGGFEIDIEKRFLIRRGRKKYEAWRWSHFPLRVEWDVQQGRYILVPEEDDIKKKLGVELY